MPDPILPQPVPADVTPSVSTPVPPAAGKKVLERMLDRLFAALVNGPSINCRPHRSRQRVDWYSLSALSDLAPAEAIEELLGPERKTTLRAKTPEPKKRDAKPATPPPTEEPLTDQPTESTETTVPTPGDDAESAGSAASPKGDTPLPGQKKWDEQTALLQKLHIIADDARTYEQDTGVHVLNVGFPLLSLPPSFSGGATRQTTRRILAPIAFIPISLTLRRGATRSIEIGCRGEGIDLVQPNTALLAWLQRQAGKPVTNGADLFADDKGENPWREIGELVRRVCALVDLPVPTAFEEKPQPAPEVPPSAEPAPAVAIPDGAVEESTAAEAMEAKPVQPPRPVTLEIQPAPRTEEINEGAAILTAGVLGLFPMANQGLLRDMQDMAEEPEKIAGPLEHFIRLGASLDIPKPAQIAAEAGPEPKLAAPPAPAPAKRRDFADERLVAEADPCQARAVRLARESRALVIHGPPGTGKSQTIANIIGDHLARGQRVLFVCEKRTALDVVVNRLDHMNIGRLAAVVHDPQRDQRELYKMIREHLDQLPEINTNPRAENKLKEVDEELSRLHAELSDYRTALARIDSETAHSFHELMGQWLSASPASLLGSTARQMDWRVSIDGPASAELAKVRLRELSPLEHPLGEMFARGLKVSFATNPWSKRVGISLPAFLARPVEQNKRAMLAIESAAAEADLLSLATMPALPPFTPKLDLPTQGTARVQLAGRIVQTLQQTPPDILERWATKPFTAIRAARAKLTELQPYLAAFRHQALDAELVSLWSAAIGRDLPAVADLTQERDTIQRYARAFATSNAWIEEIRQKVPAANWPTVARWVATETNVAAAVLKKLEVVAPLAERASAAPLDAELAAQYRRQPFALAQVLQWQSAIETYLPISRSFLGFLHGSTKKAATPAVQFFGLGLTAESATRVRDFLAGLRARLEVWDAAGKAIGASAFGNADSLPEDPDLLGVFNEHRGVLRAALDLHRPSLPDALSSPDATALVNRMVAAEHRAAEPLFRQVGLPATPESAIRLEQLYEGLIVRVVLQNVNESVLNAPTPDDLMDDHDLHVSFLGHESLFELAMDVNAEPMVRDLWQAVSAALATRQTLPALMDALNASPKRAALIVATEKALADAGLFSGDALAGFDASLRRNETFTPTVNSLTNQLETLEDVVRVLDAVAATPPAVRRAAASLLDQSASPGEAWDVLRRDVVAAEIRRRLAADPQLQGVDGHRLSTAFDRYRELEKKKRGLVCEVVVDFWVQKQQDALLVETGSRLNANGAELRRRLLLRGERAMRLRQVIARGREIPGGDPLFDVCPVWMVSPETAAQIFPREPIFDVVIFDEASQCRLEEALPVLTRGQRVVIAGDPKQLPPTRFFETAFTTTADEDDSQQSDQAWFEEQQGEVEDLLTAALGLEAQQSYLDVHYRSKNAALIEFSNEHFYGSRLQPIPGHPSRRAKLPPVRIVRAAGVYVKRVNEIEAEAVVQLVKELLAQRQPPSIGIACFNMVQRDLIVEKLDDAAADDAKFAKQLNEARDRVGTGTFEGLFVKNLENVQGDERDHMIISTTYGPDPAGRFYRRFGPLAMPGGGRRLNVLVTRARQQVHLVTSIPPEAYRSLPEPADGQTPGGGWLLFSYLKFAEELAREFTPDAGTAESPAVNGSAEKPPVEIEFSSVPKMPVRVLPTRAPSHFAESLARKLATAHGTSAEVYWGNDGFCVDVAIADQETPDDVKLGVLCDAARFAPAEDLMEWDVFRTGILEQQGWKIHRVWTPHFFRDPVGRTAALLRDAGRAV